nr:MAG TPA: hypothetical protein [Caudoviricetes sp.]DAU58426.1 MAG TPA: hypothetical protein [Caudoviricetes sp.]
MLFENESLVLSEARLIISPKFHEEYLKSPEMMKKAL